MTRYICLLFILCCCTWKQTTAVKMNAVAQQILLDILTDMEKDTDDVKKCTPAYRMDLPKKLVDFYVVELDKTYFIMSAGKHTGLQDLVAEGDLPSPITEMDKMAVDDGTSCSRYYVLTALAEMMCEDADGNIVAYSLAQSTIDQKKDGKTVENHIRSNEAFFKKYWKERKRTLRRERKKEDAKETSNEQAETRIRLPQSHKRSADDENKEIIIKPISPGDSARVALGDAEGLDSVEIIFIPLESDTDAVAEKMRAKLCRVISNCQMVSGKSIILSSSFIKDSMGDSICILKLADNAEEVLGPREVIFEVDVGGADGQHFYEVLYESKVQKRKTEYKSWSGFSYYSINDWYKFPKYNQFKYGGGDCSVGCGPVAWAMVFGYLDRWPSKGSTGLYRDGYNGVTGNPAIKAPEENDNRMDNYIKYLNSKLDTNCGTTSDWKMDNVEGFYKSRQTYGSPKIIDKQWNPSVNGFTVDLVKKGWPTIVRIYTTNKKWHYPVAIRIRRRWRKYRKCWWFFGWHCGSWKTQSDTDMYLNMGWGGSWNGWYNVKGYFAIAAVY